MSLQSKIVNLISGITDPTMRVDVASTINYFFSLYSTGRATEGELRDSLLEVCLDIIGFTHPELTQDEVKERSKILVEEIMRSFKVEGTVRRMMSRFRGKMAL